MPLSWQILIALGADVLFGDPKWLPHPVRLIGAFAARLEKEMRQRIAFEFIAGGCTVAVVVLSVGAAVFLVLKIAAIISPAAADAVSIFLLYTTFAVRDLSRHGMAVYRPLSLGDLPAARQKVSMMVGRDTAMLDTEGIARAAVESIAENTVDGVTAPLLFAIAGGPVAALVYKAVNTMDSMFGYKTPRYLRFGWAAARLDDVINFIPARISAACMILSCVVLRWRPDKALSTLRKDSRKHPSPNAGLCEAVMAGALGVRLGGRSHYFGQPSEKPLIGESGRTAEAGDIRRAIALMAVTCGIVAIVFLLSRWLVVTGIGR